MVNTRVFDQKVVNSKSPLYKETLLNVLNSIQKGVVDKNAVIWLYRSGLLEDKTEFHKDLGRLRTLLSA